MRLFARKAAVCAETARGMACIGQPGHGAMHYDPAADRHWQELRSEYTGATWMIGARRFPLPVGEHKCASCRRALSGEAFCTSEGVWWLFLYCDGCAPYALETGNDYARACYLGLPPAPVRSPQ